MIKSKMQNQSFLTNTSSEILIYDDNIPTPMYNETALRALEKMRMRLLDLTPRNRLINYRHTASSLRVIDELPNHLVETLLNETEMEFKSIPNPTEKELIEFGYLEVDKETQNIIEKRKKPNAKEWAEHIGVSTHYEMPESSSNDKLNMHSDNAIQTLLFPHEMETRLKRLLQISKSAIEEMGTNILYISFGFLEWYEDTNSNVPRFAPLFLLPVRIRKGYLNSNTNTYEYTLIYSGEDIISNLSLREKLREDFAMALPELDENTVPEDYFKKVQELIKKQPRWKVCRYISLVLLNFNKLLMYLDLDPSRWPNANILNHSIVSRFLFGTSQKEVDSENNPLGDLGFGEKEHLIDEIENIHTNYPLVDDADSSQYNALIDAVDGKSLVIEGPPGTGKSQTITNLIASAMSQGKKVLFVSEKLAALEVVYRRLDAVGLGEFCLELHSHKSQKRKVLDEIEKRIEKHHHYSKPKNIESDINYYENLKNRLKDYVEKINQSWKNTDKTLHEVFMAARRYRNVIGDMEVLYPEGYNGSNYDVATHRHNKDQIDIYQKLYKVILEQSGGDVLQKHPWRGVFNTDLQIFDLEQVQIFLKSWQRSLKLLLEQWNTIIKVFDYCETLDVINSVSEISTFLVDLESIPLLEGDEILECLPVLHGDTLKKAENYLCLFENIQDLYSVLSKRVNLYVLQDLSVVNQHELLLTREQFKIVKHDIKLGTLKEVIDQLIVIENQVEQLKDPLGDISSALGVRVAEYLTVSELGLIEFKTIIDLVASLNPSFWKYRDELFDNDELDELLPRLRIDLEELKVLQDKVEGIFSLDKIPDKSEILHLGDILESGGTLRWFKGRWRKARKQLLSYSSNSHVKFQDMLVLLDDVSVFAEKRINLEQNTFYKEAFKKYWSGMDTDLSVLESLRSWYKYVRQQYGIGFGKKVSLGNAIIDLELNVAKSVRSLYDQGIKKQIEDLLYNLDNCKNVFSPVIKLHDKETLLVGEKRIISYLLNELNQVVKVCSLITNDDSLSVTNLVDLIDQLILLKQRIEEWENFDFDNKIFQGMINLKTGINTDNSIGVSVLRNTLKFANYIKNLSNQTIIKYIYKNPTKEIFTSLLNNTNELRTAIELEKSSKKDYINYVNLDPVLWMFYTGDCIDKLIIRNQAALDNSETLEDWIHYVIQRNQIIVLGMERFIDAVEKSVIQIDQIKDAYQAGIFDLLAREILKEDPELSRFSGLVQEDLQIKFKEYDKKLKKLQQEQIGWKIDQTEIPIGNRSSRTYELTDLALLERECSKKKQHIPIRQLLKRAGNALLALKPCFMMGPMSVAQYLEPGKFNFDMVVMDEASQIKPEDALGAIARGKRVIVVGDPKQLPPTNFFERINEENDDEEDITTIEESESILDAMLTMFPKRRLLWHYRSRHENLIAFSNHFFYEHSLKIFPSPNKESKNYGIQYFPVSNGCFINSKNKEEAKIISEAVREHFKYRFKETLGVVAMNAEQSMEIEMAIEALAKEDEMFQKLLDKDTTRYGHLFIKNLENVQGDERDVIFISMTYGPQTPNGKLYQRFGPINKESGGRRLNVLFTRSRKRMCVFSSMRSSDIIISPTSKSGVQALRNFLSYCETGGTIPKNGPLPEPDSDFEIAVMSALHDEGFECIPQVGVQGFFIDISVLDPNNRGRYLMGIECDGATYHSAKSVRDRDRLRQEILEGLGWRIRRIWSTDWFKNSRATLAPIVRELHELKSPTVFVETDEDFEIDKDEQNIEDVEIKKVQNYFNF